MKYDEVTAPKHYVSQSAQMQPIDVIRTAPFDLGNCIKYVIRAGHKGDKNLDLEKAAQYLKWAYESCYIDPNPYYRWWDSYGLLVVKFKVFAGIHTSGGVMSFMDQLEHGVLKNYFTEE